MEGRLQVAGYGYYENLVAADAASFLAFLSPMTRAVLLVAKSFDGI
jgi:hypothetical protein